MSTDQTPAQARATEANNNGVGWYEVIHPTAATTLLAYVHEDGSVYFPETNDGRAEFEFAAARGNVHRLVRADDAEHAHATVSAALHDPDDPDWLARELWDAHRVGLLIPTWSNLAESTKDHWRERAIRLAAAILGEVPDDRA